MKFLLSLTLALVAAISVFATGQEPDRLIYQNQERMLFSNPLEDYYTSSRKRPNYMVEPFTTSSGNWRGYVATWEIVGGDLFLTKVDSWLCNGTRRDSCRQVTLNQLFPNSVKGGKVLANWFSGKLRVPDGKELRYVHMGYGSTYERDLIFVVRAGKVSDPTVFDNTKAPLPSEIEAARRELEKLKAAEDKKASVPRERSKRMPKSGITIIPGQGVFSYGTKKKDLEAVVGEGEASSKFDDVYFVEYPAAGAQVSYDNLKHTVHVIFLYNNAPRYEGFAVPKILTDKGISWNATDEDIVKAYGKPLKDYSDESKSWRRLEYPRIDFLFQGGHLGRIGILGPDGN